MTRQVQSDSPVGRHFLDAGQAIAFVPFYPGLSSAKDLAHAIVAASEMLLGGDSPTGLAFSIYFRKF